MGRGREVGDAHAHAMLGHAEMERALGRVRLARADRHRHGAALPDVLDAQSPAAMSPWKMQGASISTTDRPVSS